MEEFAKLVDILDKHNVLMYKSDGKGACEIVFKRAQDMPADEDDEDSEETEGMEAKESDDDDNQMGFTMYRKIPNLVSFERE